MTILLIINISMSLIFIMLTHPLSMGLILLIQTLVISLITGNFNPSFWFSYILFLILVGGMLILFMYMTSIASNEKFTFNMKSLIIANIIPLIMIIPTMWMTIETINNETMLFTVNKTITLSINKYINYPTNLILTFTIIYLLLALIATVKISSFKHGPLRQMN